MRQTRFWTLAAAGALLVLTGVACGSSPGPSVLGRYEHRRLNVDGETYSYTVYLPGRHQPLSGMALVVVLHGCAESASEMAAASDYGRVADQSRFIVLYPEAGSTDIAADGCWRGIWDPSLEGRGRGDAGAIARMTRAVIENWRIDRARVYVIGISAGAFEAEILGAAYPDLFAAIGIHSGGAYGGGQAGCLIQGGVRRDVATLARAALSAMGTHTHLMPVIAFHGAQDGRIPYRCGREALAQWLATDDLILGRQHRAPLPSAPTKVWRAGVPAGDAYNVASYEISPGCPVGQFWTIHGMGHYWSGGSADPASAQYSDPRGPSAARASWEFFSRWRLFGADDSCGAPAR